MSEAEMPAVSPQLQETSADWMQDQVELMLVEMNGRRWLVRVDDVARLIKPQPLTVVPMGPDHILGLANVQGQVYCITDAGKQFSMAPHAPASEHSRWMLMRHSRIHMGVWVDRVLDLFRINKDLLPQETGHALEWCELEVQDARYPLLNAAVLIG